MNTFFEKHVTKKGLLIFASFMTLLFLVLLFNEISGLCSPWRGNCIDSYHYRALVIFWAPALLFVSLVISALDKKILNAWITFAIPWLVASSVAIYLTPLKSKLDELDWKGVMALSTTILFFIISILIILIKSFLVYRKKK